jgi:hypothetical protein
MLGIVFLFSVFCFQREVNLFSYHLAQLNIEKIKYSIDSDNMSGFVDNLDRINALAERSPGFVWRLQTDEGDATGIDYFGSDVLVNMSVWTDVASLHQYVYKTVHADMMSQRKIWFDRIAEAYSVLWWVADDRFPTLNESAEKLELLKSLGSTRDAFTIKRHYPQPD